MRRPKKCKTSQAFRRRKIIPALEIPCRAFSDMMAPSKSRATPRMIVENFKGIMQYEKRYHQSILRRFILVLKGRQMEIKNMNETGF